MIKKVFLLPFLLAAICVTAAAQTQTRSRRVTVPQSAQIDVSTGPSLDKPANHSAKQNPSDSRTTADSEPVSTEKFSQPGDVIWGNTAVVNPPPPVETVPAPKPTEMSASSAAPRKLIERTSMPVESSVPRNTWPPAVNVAGTSNVASSAPAVRKPGSPMDEYRVGVGDVLDVRVLDMPSRESTLFTVLKNGSIEHPLLNAPVNVSGMTTDEIAGRLTGEIKVIEHARVTVLVRDYASHAVVITGLVDNPGRKMLRRESMPLYAVLAEALPRAEASFATIVRNQQAGQPIALNDQKAMSMPLVPGDVVKISGKEVAPKQFVYVGGQVTSPGEKDFREGMTLTQAILASGGVVRDAVKSVKISRRNAEGFLIASEYDMRAIQEGKSPDPLIQAGDRIEVGRALW